MHNHSYENEFNLHVNEITFSYEKMGTKIRFEEEAKGNSEMAYQNEMTQSERKSNNISIHRGQKPCARTILGILRSFSHFLKA